MHLNVRSLIAKMNKICIWAYSTYADVIVLSETWLSKSVLDKDINVDGYNVYRTEVSRTLHITVVGCYMTPSAVSGALSSTMQPLSGLNFNEMVVIGDLNWNWNQYP